MPANEAWQAQLEALGAFIRAQRQLADLSLREMADVAKISNAYLSQVERGLHQPSVRVLRSIAGALNLPADELLAHAGLSNPARAARSEPLPDPPRGAGRRASTASTSTSEAAILADPALTDDQRQALLAVYRSFVPRGG